jgi:hypothetical protein
MGSSAFFNKIFTRRRGREKSPVKGPSFVPRAPRVLGNLLERLTLHLIHGQDVLIPKIVDISVSGVAVQMRELPSSSLQLGDKLRGRVLLSGEELSVELLLVRLEQNIIGFRFVGSFSRLRGLLYQYFTPEFLGAGMLAVAQERLARRGSGLTARWFTSESGDVLYFALDPTGVIRILELNVFGIRIRLNQEDALQIAFSEGISENDAVWSRTLPADAIVYIRRFLLSIQGLSPIELRALDEVFAS